MVTIRIVTATGTGPTEMAAYDSALAAVGAEKYNLVRLSSVIPPEAEVVSTTDLSTVGDIGDRLHVVQAVATTTGEDATAGLAWADTARAGGLFYEASAQGHAAAATVEAELEAGIAHGIELRDWTIEDRDRHLVSVSPGDDTAGCALVLAAYGRPDEPW